MQNHKLIKMGNNVGVEDFSKKYSSDILSNYDSKSGEDASGEESLRATFLKIITV